MMNEKKYRTLVARLEREADTHPSRYRLKVLALALCVPGAVAFLSGAVFAAVLASGYLLAQGRFGGALLGVCLAVLAATVLWPMLRVKPEAPTGLLVGSEDAQRFFAVIDKVRAKVHGPRIDEVRITTEFAISIVSTPRLGVLGWHRHTLLVGLPLLQILSRKEFSAMLTRDYTHLSGSYSRLGGWLYRQRASWNAIAYALATRQPGWHAWLAHRLMRGFLPYFEAYSCVMTRRTEFLADQLAAHVVGGRIVADALISMRVGERFLAQWFWPNLWSRANRSPQPHYLPHALMRKALHAAIDDEVAARWLDEALSDNTESYATNPCLRDRLVALEQTPELPPKASYSAAQTLLTDTLNDLVNHFDQQWLAANLAAWQQQHTEAQAAQEVVEEFARYKPTELLAADQYRYGLALKTLGRNTEALHLLRLAADSPQGSAEAAMATASMLQSAGDEATIRYLELAMHRDASLKPVAAVSAANFYIRRGEEDKADTYWEQVAHLRAA